MRRVTADVCELVCSGQPDFVERFMAICSSITIISRRYMKEEFERGVTGCTIPKD